MLKNFKPNLIIKFSKKEYLEDLKRGNVYFKAAKYYREVECKGVSDTRDGKTRMNMNSIKIQNPETKEILEVPADEINCSIRNLERTPIFCCSIVDQDIITRTSSITFDFTEEFINEMKSWGNCFMVIDAYEFASKMYDKCRKEHLLMIVDKIKYDQETRKKDVSDFFKEYKEKPFEPFFHKTSNFKNQNELRFIVQNNKLNLIDNDKDYFILNIGELESAVIYECDDLHTKGLILEKA